MRSGRWGLVFASLMGLMGCHHEAVVEAPPNVDCAVQCPASPAKPASATGGTGGSGPAGAMQSAPALPENALRGTVVGRIVELGPSKVVVEDRNARRFWLQMTPQTVITVNGRTASALAFREGTLIRATFASERGRRVLTRAEVIAQPQ